MEEIGTISLTESSEIIFYIDSYRGKQFANIRKFVKSKKYTGPSKSGIKLNKTELQKIYESLRNLSVQTDDLQESEICKIPVHKGKSIRVGINFFNGSYGLDIREYLETKKYSGPSRKGVRIPVDCFEDIILHLEDLLRKIDEWPKGTLFADIKKDSQPEDRKEKSENKKEIEGVPDEYKEYF